MGKEVSYTVEYKAPGTGREYGAVYVGKGQFCVCTQASVLSMLQRDRYLFVE